MSAATFVKPAALRSSSGNDAGSGGAADGLTEAAGCELTVGRLRACAIAIARAAPPTRRSPVSASSATSRRPALRPVCGSRSTRSMIIRLSCGLAGTARSKSCATSSSRVSSSRLRGMGGHLGDRVDGDEFASQPQQRPSHHDPHRDRMQAKQAGAFRHRLTFEVAQIDELPVSERKPLQGRHHHLVRKPALELVALGGPTLIWHDERRHPLLAAMVVDGEVGDRPVKPALELWLRLRCSGRSPDPGKCFLHDVLRQLEISYLHIGKLQRRWSERLDQGFEPVAVLLVQFRLPSSLSTTTGRPECDSRLLDSNHYDQTTSNTPTG